MILRFIACVFILSLLTACSADDLTDANGKGTEGSVRLSVIFATPTGNATRASTNSTGGSTDGEETGNASESRISSALVILGALPNGASTPTVVHSIHTISPLYPLTDNRWFGELKAAPGHYRLLVIANPTPQMPERLAGIVGQPWQEALQTTAEMTDYEELEQIWQPDRFLMTNAFQNSITENDVTLVKGKEDTQVTVRVQRACARFDFRTTKAGNSYPINTSLDGTPITATVTLTHAGLMNISRGFHIFKQICSDEAGINATPYTHENANNYVYDIDWAQKKTIREDNTPEAIGLFFCSSEANDTIDYENLPTDETVYTPMFYCSENTIPGISQQVNCISTAIVFSGYFTIQGVTATDLYYIENKEPLFYTSLEKLKAENGITLPDNPDNVALAAAGIKHFKANGEGRFPVWYTYWNRHNDNGNSIQMGTMEFAVVRNNIYKLSVNNIRFFGLPKGPTDEDNPWKPEGNTPDEQGAQLDVNVTVSGWIDRIYDCEI